MKRTIQPLLLGIMILVFAGCTTTTRQPSQVYLTPTVPPSVAVGVPIEKTEPKRPSWAGQFFVTVWTWSAGHQISTR